MTKRTYSLELKIYIIKELLSQVIEEQKIYKENPDCFGEDFWLWNQAERCAYLTALDILDDDISYMAKCTLENAHNKMEEDRNKSIK